MKYVGHNRSEDTSFTRLLLREIFGNTLRNHELLVV
jgi:hypothetical protein